MAVERTTKILEIVEGKKMTKNELHYSFEDPILDQPVHRNINKIPSLVMLASKALAKELADSDYNTVQAVFERVAMDKNLLRECMLDFMLEMICCNTFNLCIGYFIKKKDWFRAFNAVLKYNASCKNNNFIIIACYLGLSTLCIMQ